MKKISGLFIIVALLALSGCFDTVQEATINDDGSGLYVSTMDMGKLLGMIKMVASKREPIKLVFTTIFFIYRGNCDVTCAEG